MTQKALPKLVPKPLSGDESFLLEGAPAGFTLLEFWRWSCSDLVSNALRGVLAEFLVAKALGLPTDQVRTEWDMCDLRTPSGLLIEVKSAGYLQSWAQSELSRIRFVVSPRRGWDADTDTYSDIPRRNADIYVFALLAHQDKATVNPLDLAQWQFWAVNSAVLDSRTQQSLTLPSLRELAGSAVSFAELGNAVERVARPPTAAG